MSQDSVDEYDLIFAGGGTAAGVIAGRLAAADPRLRILIMETGPSTKDQPFHVQPARYLAHLAPTTSTVRFYVGRESEHLGGRRPIVPVGACLGGGSSVNFTMYTRASPSDYDDWKTVYKNDGWGYEDLLPLFKKTETYQIAEGKHAHGYEGPLKVSYGGIFTKIGQDFLEVAANYDKEFPLVQDTSPLAAVNGYGRWAKWISADKGTRSDVPHHFLYNQAHNQNLVIETGCSVKRVLFEGTRAVGVEYSYNPRVRPNEERDVLRVARAGKLVVVSAGALGSPQILERSGIGRKDVLDKAGVDQLVDLPGVGENFQDHQLVFQQYYAAEDCDTLDGIVRSDPLELEKWERMWEKDGTGMMANKRHIAIDAGSKLRPTPSELRKIGPAFGERWKEYYLSTSHEDKPVYFLGVGSSFLGDKMAESPYRKYLSIGYILWYPSSYGYVHITSKDDTEAPPDFDPAYCSTTDDMELLNFLYKKAREFARRLPSFRGEYPPSQANFAPESKAAVQEDCQPISFDAPDISYTEEDDKAIEAWNRANVNTCWHPIGTCAMKPREEGGVVDPALNVYGTQGLKVADASIAPGNVGSNTYSTALVIGEKAALIIAGQLGIEGV
ncbi:alcohol oxidase-like protein [Punctularia strigosozonata HHB-11173 SS5]|uniref:alcohol oxidase-like protein n=1 Tax=Punctularia strigosozonata (strain HHB-11173) TaxID=741275 RepID=UPI00044168EC|nr:alcohol oxidase-like protein [Punctularia strigosozonata HHB-11173 SS5]EIN11008.1 alcohol oxidase-like protein [Punctularia strigosozonata HHB-11173 SS5]